MSDIKNDSTPADQLNSETAKAVELSNLEQLRADAYNASILDIVNRSRFAMFGLLIASFFILQITISGEKRDNSTLYFEHNFTDSVYRAISVMESDPDGYDIVKAQLYCDHFNGVKHTKIQNFMTELEGCLSSITETISYAKEDNDSYYEVTEHLEYLGALEEVISRVFSAYESLTLDSERIKGNIRGTALNVRVVAPQQTVKWADVELEHSEALPIAIIALISIQLYMLSISNELKEAVKGQCLVCRGFIAFHRSRISQFVLFAWLNIPLIIMFVAAAEHSRLFYATDVINVDSIYFWLAYMLVTYLPVYNFRVARWKAKNDPSEHYSLRKELKRILSLKWLRESLSRFFNSVWSILNKRSEKKKATS